VHAICSRYVDLALAAADLSAVTAVAIDETSQRPRHLRRVSPRRPRSRVIRMIRKHFAGIVAWTQTRQTNGFIEALNGLFQVAKRKARGYTRFDTMRTVIFPRESSTSPPLTHMPHNPLRIQKRRSCRYKDTLICARPT
jgi:hypothetical protein